MRHFTQTYLLRPSLSVIAALACAGMLTACSHQDVIADVKDVTALDVQKIHHNALVIDAHADIMMPDTNPLYIDRDGTSKVSVDKLKAGGVDAVVMSIAVGPAALETKYTSKSLAAARIEADQKLAVIKAKIVDENNQFKLATTSDDIRAAEKSEHIAIILGFQNARALQGNVDDLDYFYDQGVRIFALNHLGNNQFSDSSRPQYDSTTKSYEPNINQGLSAKGKAAIAKINTLGGVVDVTQMSEQATLQAIALSTTPVIASHSNAKPVTNVTRNLSDTEIDAIGKNGGVIHIAPFGAYLVDLSTDETQAAIKAMRIKHGLPVEHAYPYELYWELPDQAAAAAFIYDMRGVIGAGSLDDMMNHIDYIVDRIGIDHVGIGTDFNHGSGIDGFANASQAINLTQAMIDRGYSEDDITKIWGGNFLRVLDAAR